MNRKRSQPTPRPCGCVAGPAVILTRCAEAERLWSAFRALGDRASSVTPEWRAYAAHFDRMDKEAMSKHSPKIVIHEIDPYGVVLELRCRTEEEARNLYQRVELRARGFAVTHVDAAGQFVCSREEKR